MMSRYKYVVARTRLENWDEDSRAFRDPAGVRYDLYSDDRDLPASIGRAQFEALALDVKWGDVFYAFNELAQGGLVMVANS